MNFSYLYEGEGLSKSFTIIQNENIRSIVDITINCLLKAVLKLSLKLLIILDKRTKIAVSNVKSTGKEIE